MLSEKNQLCTVGGKKKNNHILTNFDKTIKTKLPLVLYYIIL